MKEVKSTKKYEIFKELKGNRDVSPTRVKKIIDSIKNVGYITSPIIVNENMEVIDGQGRLKALQFLKMPVEYIVHKGIGIEECLSMNIHQTNWTLRDYIKSYADRGLQSFVYLQDLIDTYKNLTLLTIVMACQGTTKYSKKIYRGELDVTENDYEKIKEKLDYLTEVISYFKFKNGAKSYLEYSLLVCQSLDCVDLNRLKERLKEDSSIMRRWNSVPTCLQAIEDVYNVSLAYPVFLYTEYRKTLYKKLGYESGSKTQSKLTEQRLKH